MSGIGFHYLATFAFAVPPLYGAVGAWLSRLSGSGGAWDEFFSTWPFFSVGCLVGASSCINLVQR
jgi:hypothetical protein